RRRELRRCRAPDRSRRRRSSGRGRQRSMGRWPCLVVMVSRYGSDVDADERERRPAGATRPAHPRDNRDNTTRRTAFRQTLPARGARRDHGRARLGTGRELVRRCGRRSDRPLFQLAPLALGQPAPDSEAFVMFERVLQALGPHVTAQAHPLRLTGGPAFLRKKRLRISLGAQRPLLPTHLFGVAQEQAHFVPLGHGSPPPTSSGPWAGPRCGSALVVYAEPPNDTYEITCS